jgi:hypothetical protein
MYAQVSWSWIQQSMALVDVDATDGEDFMYYTADKTEDTWKNRWNNMCKTYKTILGHENSTGRRVMKGGRGNNKENLRARGGGEVICAN